MLYFMLLKNSYEFLEHVLFCSFTRGVNYVEKQYIKGNDTEMFFVLYLV